jgi:hypothetical protein
MSVQETQTVDVENREKFWSDADRTLWKKKEVQKALFSIRIGDKTGLWKHDPTSGASYQHTRSTTTYTGIQKRDCGLPELAFVDEDTVQSYFCNSMKKVYRNEYKDQQSAIKVKAKADKAAKKREKQGIPKNFGGFKDVDAQAQEPYPDELMQATMDLTREWFRAEIRTKYGSELLHMIETSPGRVKEIRGFHPLTTDGNGSVTWRWINRECTDNSRVGIIPLLEPLKIRIISKGNDMRYWLAKPVQSAMHTALRETVPFCLIGRTLEKSDLERLAERTHAFGKLHGVTFDHMVSGDFAGATDTTNINATKAAFESFLDRSQFVSRGVGISIPKETSRCDARCSINTKDQAALNPEVKLLLKNLRSVLYEQWLTYKHPKMEECMDSEDGMFTQEQRNGQLMGSPLSFPILCLLNLCGYWKAIETFVGKKVAFCDLPVLVNGDDILFFSIGGEDGEFYKLWKSALVDLGFTLSIGKNYVHETVCTINSACFIWNRSLASPCFKQVRHLDVGLMTNNTAASRLEVRALPFVEKMTRSLEGAKDKVRCFNRLKHYYKDEIKQWTQSGKYNLFGAVELGTLGVKLVAGIDPCYTAFQRRFAGFLKQQIESAVCLEDLEYETIRIKALKDGAGHSAPSTMLPCHKRIFLKDVGEINEEEDVLAEAREIPHQFFCTHKPRTFGLDLTRFSWATRKGFAKSFNAGIVPLADPSVWEKKAIFVQWGSELSDYNATRAKAKRLHGHADFRQYSE